MFLFALLSCMPAFAQEPSRNRIIETSFHYGSIVPHHEFMHEFLEGALLAGELKYGIQSTGKSAWEQWLGYPVYGFGYYFGTIGNRQVLGLPQGVYSFMEFPLLRTGRLKFGNQIALGLSYNLKVYDPETNPLNLAMSTWLNVFFSFNLNLGIRITDHLVFKQGANFAHFSNGAVKIPNTGFYMLDYYSGLQFDIDPTPYRYNRHDLPAFSRSNHFQAVLAGGTKQTEYKGKQYFMSTLSLAFARKISRVNRIGIGADLFYDAGLEQNFPEGLPFHWLLRQGFFAGHELLIWKFSVIVQQGIYGYRKINLHQKYYSRLALRYHLTDHAFMNISLKSHWGKADYIEWGAGYSF